MKSRGCLSHSLLKLLSRLVEQMALWKENGGEAVLQKPGGFKVPKTESKGKSYYWKKSRCDKQNFKKA